VVYQGHYHCAWLDLWRFSVVVFLSNAGHQFDLDLGIKQETVAYLGGI
jgi:hypothetical protein